MVTCRLFFALLKQERLPIPTPEHRFDAGRRWRMDYAWQQHMVALEVEGGVWTQGRHTRSAGFLADMEKYNAAAVLGWRIIRCTPDDLLRATTIDLLRGALHNVDCLGTNVVHDVDCLGTNDVPKNGPHTIIGRINTNTKTKSKKERKKHNNIVENGQLWIDVDNSFDVFWEAYGKKVDRLSCSRRWEKLPDDERRAVMDHVPRYVKSTPVIQYRKNPEAYLNRRAWENQIIEATDAENPKPIPGRHVGIDDLAERDRQFRMRNGLEPR